MRYEVWDNSQAEGVECGKVCSRRQTWRKTQQLEGGREGGEPLLRFSFASLSCLMHPVWLVKEGVEKLSASVHNNDEH